MNDARNPIIFTVPGIPVAQPRCRFTTVRRKVRAYVPAKHPVHTFRDAIAWCFRQAYRGPPLDGPLGLWVRFEFPGSRAVRRKPMGLQWYAAAKRHDWDNLAKALCDALTGLAWRDDGQIALAHVERMICAAGQTPRTCVMIWPLDEAEDLHPAEHQPSTPARMPELPEWQGQPRP